MKIWISNFEFILGPSSRRLFRASAVIVVNVDETTTQYREKICLHFTSSSQNAEVNKTFLTPCYPLAVQGINCVLKSYKMSHNTVINYYVA